MVRFAFPFTSAHRWTSVHLAGQTPFISAAAPSSWHATAYFLTAPALEASGSAQLGAGQERQLPWCWLRCRLSAAGTMLPAINPVAS